MKKVLIVTYYFAQAEQIGSMRLRGLAKHLPEFGWKPLVMTPRNNAEYDFPVRIEQTDNNDLISKWKVALGIDPSVSLKGAHGLPDFSTKNKKTLMDFAMQLWEEFFAYPDLCSGWHQPALETGRRLLREEKFDAIISSSGPVTCHLIARDLKEEFGTPWIADLRDLWTQNHYYHHTSIRKLIERKLERETLAQADSISTVSDQLKTQLLQIHPKKDIFVVHNGFDAQDLDSPVLSSPQFTITYTGSLYRGRRDPEQLFRAIRELIDEGRMKMSDISLVFVGETEEWLSKDAEKYSLEDIVSVLGHLTRKEAIRRQRESQVLLLLTWNDPRESGVYTGKLFDYLASRRPIISIGVHGSVIHDLLEATRTGVHVSTVDDIKVRLLEKYLEFKSTGKATYGGIEEEVCKYTHNEMARKFARILDDIST